MKSCWIQSETKGTSFLFRDVPKPQPKAGEIVVRVRAAPLNRGELLAQSAHYKADAPRPAGGDAAGEVHAKRLQIYGVSNARMSPADRAEAMRGFARDMLPMFADGRIVPLVDKVFPFDELPAAKTYVEGNAQVGKVVVRL